MFKRLALAGPTTYNFTSPKDVMKASDTLSEAGTDDTSYTFNFSMSGSDASEFVSDAQDSASDGGISGLKATKGASGVTVKVTGSPVRIARWLSSMSDLWNQM